MKVDLKLNVSREAGIKEITENGIHSVNGYSKVHAKVKPTGTIEITENGTHDVSEYGTANVNIDIKLKLEGLLKEYKVAQGYNINANSFVEYYNGITNSTTQYIGSAVALDDNRVFIAYCNNSSNLYLYGAIVKMENGAVVSKTTQLSSNTYSAYYGISCVKVAENRVFIARGYGSNYNISSSLVTIVGDDMTVKNLTISSTYGALYNGEGSLATKLLNNNIVLILAKDRNNYLSIYRVSTVDGNLTLLSSKEKASANIISGKLSNIIEIEENKLMVLTTRSSQLLGIILNYDTSTSAVTYSKYLTLISENVYSDKFYNYVFNKDNIFTFAYLKNVSTNKYSLVITLGKYENETLTILNETVLNDFTDYNIYSTFTYIDNDTILLLYGEYNKKIINKLFIKQIGNEFKIIKTSTINVPTSLARIIDLIPLNNGYCYSFLYNANLFVGGKLVIPYSESIDGVSIESGATGETIKVYVPNVEV